MLERAKPGMRVRVTKLGDTRGMLINPKHLDVRQEGITGVIRSYVAGHGGDVWFVEHDLKPGQGLPKGEHHVLPIVGAYSISEMEPDGWQENDDGELWWRLGTMPIIDGTSVPHAPDHLRIWKGSDGWMGALVLDGNYMLHTAQFPERARVIPVIEKAAFEYISDLLGRLPHP